MKIMNKICGLLLAFAAAAPFQACKFYETSRMPADYYRKKEVAIEIADRILSYSSTLFMGAMYLDDYLDGTLTIRRLDAVGPIVDYGNGQYYLDGINCKIDTKEKNFSETGTVWTMRYAGFEVSLRTLGGGEWMMVLSSFDSEYTVSFSNYNEDMYDVVHEAILVTMDMKVSGTYEEANVYSAESDAPQMKFRFDEGKADVTFTGEYRMDYYRGTEKVGFVTLHYPLLIDVPEAV